MASLFSTVAPKHQNRVKHQLISACFTTELNQLERGRDSFCCRHFERNVFPDETGKIYGVDFSAASACERCFGKKRKNREWRRLLIPFKLLPLNIMNMWTVRGSDRWAKRILLGVSTF